MPTARTPTRWQPRCTTAPDPAILDQLQKQHRLPPLVAQLLAQRGITTPDAAQQFLSPKLTDLPDPATLPGAADAARLITDAIQRQHPIVIYGDYDVDGITATAILFHTLVELHHTLHQTHRAKAPVATYVPHRIDEGYGLNTDALDAIAAYQPFPHLQPDDNAPPLLVTVDCGITATDAAQHARQLNLPLIITDHHLFDPDNLPDADALVHPELGSTEKSEIKNQKSNIDPDPPCGAGVAFYLAWEIMRTAMNAKRLPPPLQKLMVELLSLAALGTVADMVPLRGPNRAITATGLARIKHTRFPGLNAMIDAAKLRPDSEKVDAYHVGFVLGPRLNACGRMGHARQAVELLTTADPARSAELAAFLTQQNDERRTVEREVFALACERIEQEKHATPDRRAIVLDDPDWHPGVVGIVASRLVERYHRPVVLLCHEDSATTAKGSARSVPQVHIQQAFNACAKHLQKFGGHAMAAGLTLDIADIENFRAAMIEHINTQLPQDQLTAQESFDADALESDLRAPVFAALNTLAPFGQGNPSPRLRLQNARIDAPPRRVGRSADHLTLQLRVGQTTIRSIAFGRGEDAETLGVGDHLDILFQPKLNTWQGVTRPELNILDFHPTD